VVSFTILKKTFLQRKLHRDCKQIMNITSAEKKVFVSDYIIEIFWWVVWRNTCGMSVGMLTWKQNKARMK
jgi:hypothetical protein